MIDCISRDSVCLNKHVFYHPKDGIARNNGYDPADWAIRISDVMDVPTADVVARDCYDRILAENDTMREQLAQIGKKPGDRMDDVRPVELELRPIRFIAELKTLDWSELTPEERVRLLNVRNIPDAVMQALQGRYKELRDAVVNLEAEMDQISDFVEGFWRNTEGGTDDV